MGKFWKKKVEWSPAGAGTWTDLGQIHTDSAHNPDAVGEEASSGVELYAGTQDPYEMRIYDASKYPALRTQMLDDDGLVDLRFTDAEDNTETEEGFSVIVSEPKSFGPRTRQAFNARFSRTFI